jgi:hypothetical protein
MGGGLLQLVAISIQDTFLIKDPQITFFKLVYRRHTNFSMEQIKIDFNGIPNFGKKVSCTLSKAGDLIHKVWLVTKLPTIPKFFDENNNEHPFQRIAWAKRIGYALIKTIEVEIGGQVIDRHYGDWMNIWYELTGNNNRGFNIIIGDVRELTSFSNGKYETELFIPLEFWFCKTIGLALPIVCLEYSKVKININFNDLNNCIIVSPTHSITLHEDIVNFKQYEYITQTINGVTSNGIYLGFDSITKKLYYNNISNHNFKAYIDSTATTDDQKKTAIRSNDGQKYIIKGIQSGYEANPELNVVEKTETIPQINARLGDTKLLVEYIFLDEEERSRMLKNTHEYMIEQLQYSGEKTIDSSIKQIRLGFLQPTKELIFVMNLTHFGRKNINDYFNYTNDFKHCPNTDVWLGNSLVKNATLKLNGHDAFSERDNGYWNYLQPYWHHKRGPCEGINVYSFALNPEKIQPSGSTNLSTIDHIMLNVVSDNQINFNNTAKLRAYTTSINILRIAHGMSGLVFTNQKQ